MTDKSPAIQLPPGANLLYSAEEIQAMVVKIADQLNLDERFQDGNTVVIGCLKGAAPITSDLIRLLNFRLKLDFMKFSSYEGTETTGTVNIYSDISTPVEGCHIIIVEDILDTRRSMQATIHHLRKKKPASITVVALLDKPSRKEVDFEAESVVTGTVIENLYVFGYGLDKDQDWRQLPGIYYIP
jgi:hypoxanthine phosphoribosyltransferase